MIIKTNRPIKYKGQWIQPGQIVDLDLPKKEIDGLMTSGVIGKNEVSGPASSDDGAGSGDNFDRAAAIEELSQVKGVNKDIAGALIDKGYKSIEDLQKASAEDLVEISGIGQKTSVSIIEDANEFE